MEGLSRPRLKRFASGVEFTCCALAQLRSLGEPRLERARFKAKLENKEDKSLNKNQSGNPMTTLPIALPVAEVAALPDPG